MTDDKSRPTNREALFGIIGTMIAGVIGVVVFSMSATSIQKCLVAASVGLLVAGASSMGGGLLGFLFGIPRSLQASDTSAGQAPKTIQSSSTAGDQAVTYRANTNLEQISDWLTKILVGVGLTQLTFLPEKLRALAGFLSPGFGDVPHPEVMAIAVVLYFAIAGFLFGYLWTRLFLGEALRAADVAALGEKISELERQMSRDANALSLVQEQLNPRGDTPEIAQKELSDAIMDASPAVKTTIYYQATDVRSKNWREEEAKPVMERTLPIFRALANSDARNEFHANHGQLGFALKDKRTPDWAEAEKELTKAIAIRGDWRTHGWLFYEFNRALCRIHVEKDTQNTKTRVSPNREGILADLIAAGSNDDLLHKITGEQVVLDWMHRNQISVESLGKSL
jgi:hypothetical protein